MNTSIINIENIMVFLRGRLPGQLIIQYSSRCNADCPQCSMRRSNSMSRHTLDKVRVRRLIDDAASKGIKSLSFTGGEPLLYLDDIVDLIAHANKAGIPFVRTGTNGFLFRNPEAADFDSRVKKIAEKLAATDLYTFWISLDSADPKTHESMRGLDGVVKGIEKALPIFHSYGIYPSVNLGINRATGGAAEQPFLEKMSPEEFQAAFTHSFEKFYQKVIDLGFTVVNACYPMSSDPTLETSSMLDASLYGAASSDAVISFSRKEKSLIFQSLYETIPKYRGKLRIFSPRCSLHNLIKKYGENTLPMFPCHGGTDFFFVDSESGRISPCGYLEKSMESLPDLKQRSQNPGNCDLCEWECFRDPSDFLGPFAEFFRTPLALLQKLRKDPQFFRLLLEDIRYYKACDYFNGRIPPRLKNMRRFTA